MLIAPPPSPLFIAKEVFGGRKHIQSVTSKSDDVTASEMNQSSDLVSIPSNCECTTDARTQLHARKSQIDEAVCHLVRAAIVQKRAAKMAWELPWELIRTFDLF